MKNLYIDNKLKGFLVLCFLIFSFSTFHSQVPEGEVDYGDHEKYPIYYKETEYTLEQIEELPHDTLYVRDTVYISDIDAFLKPYDCNLKEFVEKYGMMKEMMDSLNRLSAERIYFNFFLINDSLNQISNRIIVKEFRITAKNDLLRLNIVDREEKYNQVENPDSVRKEILFRCDDAVLTDHFLKNPDAIRRCISTMFTQMQKDSLNPIKGINLYFPDFKFREKRKMTQFVKSVRIMMDASRDFKCGSTRLSVIFLARKGIENIDRDFQYCLMQEASEVVFLNVADVVDDYAVKGYQLTYKEINSISFFQQLIGHFYIARFYNGDLDIMAQNLTDFSERSIKPVLEADYLENSWEIYLFILIFIIVIILVLVVLYYTFVPFSTLANENIESILLISIVVLLEILVLFFCTFQNMCKGDSFTIVYNNPVLIFILPLVMVLIIPFLNGIAKRRRTP
ncbi:MAG: hypothetical protein LBU57_07730 [Dysgonamonadaceae bacterium]|jgi:hypothetical protein|nr:hypothetical protein [Dysgonamonadaceae bacterium]